MGKFCRGALASVLLAFVGGGKEGLVFRAVEGAVNLTLRQARVMEQRLINMYGLGKNGGQLLNKINSVAEKYWRELGIAP